MHLKLKIPEVPFPWGSGYWPVPFSLRKHPFLLALIFSQAKFHSPQMKPCKSPDYFIKVSFHIVVDMRQGESNIFQISTSKAFLLLKIYLLWKIRPISVKRWKTVWIRACPIPGPNCPLGESPTTSLCQVECWHVWLWKYTFFIMNFLNFVWDSNDSNKTRMGFASRGIYFISVFS